MLPTNLLLLLILILVLIATSNVEFKPPQELGEGLVNEKITAVSHDTPHSTIPEVFDSSRYNAMEEMKESTNNKTLIESQLKEETSSELQKEEKPIVEPANLDVDGSDPSSSIDSSNNNPSFQQEQHQFIKTESNDLNFQRLDERELDATQTEWNLEINKEFAKVEEDENKKDDKRTRKINYSSNSHYSNLPIYLQIIFIHGMILLMLGLICMLKVLETLKGDWSLVRLILQNGIWAKKEYTERQCKDRITYLLKKKLDYSPLAKP